MVRALESKTVETIGFRTHVLTSGTPSSQAVILLHGGGPGATAEGNWGRVIDDLAQRYFVVAPDLVGFGRTQHPDPPPTSLLTWMGMRVQQVLALMDALEIRAAHVIGNSMGGALALHLLIEAPDRFLRVVLMGSAGAPVPPTEELLRMLHFYDDPRLPRFREIIRSFVYDADNIPVFERMVRERYEEAMRPESRRSYQAMYSSPQQAVALPPSVLARLPHYVLLIHGRQDRIVPLESSLYFLQHLKHADLHVFDRCGHWVNAERWNAMHLLINSFLESLTFD